MRLHQEIVRISDISFESPERFFEPLASYYYSALLTGKGPLDVSEYSYAAFYPCLIIRLNRAYIELETALGKEKTYQSPVEFLKNLYSFLPERDEPFNRCGGIGFISYEAFEFFENFTFSHKKPYPCPFMEIVFYQNYIIFHHPTQKASHVEMAYPQYAPMRLRIESKESSYKIGDFQEDWSKEVYCDKIRQIKDYILKGDVYEVNFTEQFKASFSGNPYSIFQKIYSHNPAPFSAYIHSHPNTVICNSPEMFLKVSGKKVETRPIKGTAPLGNNREEEMIHRKKLYQSGKDQAELYMIIDLLRNDISKVCNTGSVIVENPKRIERYSNLFHLVGIIKGELENSKSIIDLIAGAFPGGSITGCPKIRSMEIIQELEKNQRCLYTGSIFILNKDFFISNIIIRTAVICQNEIFLNSGGAITLDSDPEDEFNELMTKINHFFQRL